MLVARKQGLRDDLTYCEQKMWPRTKQTKTNMPCHVPGSDAPWPRLHIASKRLLVVGSCVAVRVISDRLERVSRRVIISRAIVVAVVIAVLRPAVVTMAKLRPAVVGSAIGWETVAIWVIWWLVVDVRVRVVARNGGGHSQHGKEGESDLLRRVWWKWKISSRTLTAFMMETLWVWLLRLTLEVWERNVCNEVAICKVIFTSFCLATFIPVALSCRSSSKNKGYRKLTANCIDR